MPKAAGGFGPDMFFVAVSFWTCITHRQTLEDRLGCLPCGNVGVGSSSSII